MTKKSNQTSFLTPWFDELIEMNNFFCRPDSWSQTKHYILQLYLMSKLKCIIFLLSGFLESNQTLYKDALIGWTNWNVKLFCCPDSWSLFSFAIVAVKNRSHSETFCLTFQPFRFLRPVYDSSFIMTLEFLFTSSHMKWQKSTGQTCKPLDWQNYF